MIWYGNSIVQTRRYASIASKIVFFFVKCKLFILFQIKSNDPIFFIWEIALQYKTILEVYIITNISVSFESLVYE